MALFPTPKDLTKSELKEFIGHKDEVNCVSYSSDFQFMVTGSDDQRVRVFSVKSKQCIIKLKGHEGAIKSVAVSPCDKYFASGSFDKTARIWQTSSGSCLHVLEGHQKSVEVVAFSPRSIYVCTGSWDRTAIIWSVETGCLLKTLAGHEKLVQAVAFSHDCRWLATGSWDFTVRVWHLHHESLNSIDTALSSHTGSDAEHSQPSESLSPGTDCKAIPKSATSHADAVADDSRRDLVDSNPTNGVELERNDDNNIANGSFTEESIESNEPNHNELVHGVESRDVSHSVVSENVSARDVQGRGLANKLGDIDELNEDSAQESFEYRSQHEVSERKESENANFQIDKTEERKRYDAGMDNVNYRHGNGVSEVKGKGVRVKFERNDVTQDDGRGNLPTRNNESQGRERSKNGVNGDHKGDSQMKAVEEKTKEDSVQVLEGHTGNVRVVCFSRVGMLASGSWDKTVRLWNPRNGKCLRVLEGHEGWVQALSFSHDSTFIASAADDDSVKVWDIPTGECINTLEGSTDLAQHCAFTTEGLLIASGAAVTKAKKLPPKETDEGQLLTLMNQES